MIDSRFQKLDNQFQIVGFKWNLNSFWNRSLLKKYTQSPLKRGIEFAAITWKLYLDPSFKEGQALVYIFCILVIMQARTVFERGSSFGLCPLILWPCKHCKETSRSEVSISYEYRQPDRRARRLSWSYSSVIDLKKSHNIISPPWQIILMAYASLS